MAWITFAAVEPLLDRDLSADDRIEDLIAHAQAKAEIEIGAQTEPVNAGLQAVLAEIVARFWQKSQSAKINPAALQSDTAGPFTIQDPNAGTVGLGLTNREKQELRQAAGKSSFWVQPTSRGDRLETAPIHDDRRAVEADQLLDVAGGEPAVYFDPDDYTP